jgi:5-methylcytosine-specific restriction endonuclease McrA
MSGAWSGGSTTRWRRTRVVVLARDRNRCQLKVAAVCVQTSEPMHVHHIHGKASGCPGCAADLPSHLISTCAPCNLHVGNPASAADPAAIPVSRW